MSKKTIYICGPISYNPQEAFDNFLWAEIGLKREGYNVINPFTLVEGLDLHPTKDYEKIMRICVSEMVSKAEEVCTLINWFESPGAKREVSIAREMKIPVKHITKYLKLTINDATINSSGKSS